MTEKTSQIREKEEEECKDETAHRWIKHQELFFLRILYVMALLGDYDHYHSLIDMYLPKSPPEQNFFWANILRLRSLPTLIDILRQKEDNLNQVARLAKPF